MTPIVTGSVGSISAQERTWVENIGESVEAEELEKSALLGNTNILGRGRKG